MDIMAEEKAKTVTLSDGKEYTIPPFTITLLANVEKTMGIGGKKLKEKIENEPLQSYQLIIWALLKQNHTELTPESAGLLIGLKEVKNFTEYLSGITGIAGIM